AKISAELRDGVDVGLLRRRRQIADRHVLDHASAQRAHRSHLKISCLRVGCDTPSSQAGEPSRQRATQSPRHPAAEAASFNPRCDLLALLPPTRAARKKALASTAGPSGSLSVAAMT